MDKKCKRKWEELNAKSQELFLFFEGFTNEELNKRPVEGKWSVLENINHLIVAESSSLKYMKKKFEYLGGTSENVKWGWLRYKTLNLALASPLKFKAPKVIENENNHEKFELNELKELWKQNREALTLFFNEFPRALGKKAIFRHPVAGRFNLNQTVSFFDDHFSRHEKQMRKILK